jgi:hypothetical protein
MANWALVEGKEIKELHDLLPKNWRNISGLRNSSDNLEFLKKLGWYPVLKTNENYDRLLFREIGVKHQIKKDKVEETLILVENESGILSFEQLKELFMIELRKQRNELLQQSDWTQLADVMSDMNEVDRNKWITYRQMLRNIPELYESTDDVNIGEVQWPDVNSI